MNEDWTIEDVSNYLSGMQDCRDGKPHFSHDEIYSAGYSTQYQHEQNMTAAELKL